MKRDFIIVTALWLILTALGELFAVFVDFYPVARADKGEEIEQAFRVLVYFAVPVFAFVVAVMAYTVLTRRSSGRPEEDGPPMQGRGTLPVAWFAITTGLAFVVMIYPGLIGIPVVFDEDPAPDLVVDVTGLQWAWLVTYPQYEIVRPPELVLPVDRTVQFNITSQDVLHSFWIPAFLMKIDSVPGKTTTFSLTPTKTGTFQTDPNLRVQCAEMCGLKHSKMRMPVRVVSEEEFDAWVREQKAK